MRQLRLYKADQKFQFITSSDMPKGTQTQIMEFIEGNSQNIQKHIYEDKPIQVVINRQLYLVGMVPCENVKVIQLPETGDICILPCEGGFYIAAEYEN